MKYHALLVGGVFFLSGLVLAPFTPPADDALSVVGGANSVAPKKPQRLAPIAKITVAALMRKKTDTPVEHPAPCPVSPAESSSTRPFPTHSPTPAAFSRQSSKKRLEPLLAGGSSRPSTPGAGSPGSGKFSFFTSPNSPISASRKPVRRLKKIGAAIIANRRFKEKQLKAAAAKGGILVDMPELDSSDAVVVEERDPHAVAWGCEEELTAAAVKKEWIALRHRCFLLRARMQAFRHMYTHLMDRPSPLHDVILKSSDKSKERFDGSFEFFSSIGCTQGLAEIFKFYAIARDTLNACLPLAGQLFMGHVYEPVNIYTTGIPFDENHRLPMDRVGIGFLNMLSCSVCSQEKGVRVPHSNLIRPDALDYDDVCTECGFGIFERICLGYVCDPATGIATMNTHLQIEVLKQLRIKLQEAADFLACIFP